MLLPSRVSLFSLKLCETKEAAVQLNPEIKEKMQVVCINMNKNKTIVKSKAKLPRTLSYTQPSLTSDVSSNIIVNFR